MQLEALWGGGRTWFFSLTIITNRLLMWGQFHEIWRQIIFIKVFKFSFKLLSIKLDLPCRDVTQAKCCNSSKGMMPPYPDLLLTWHFLTLINYTQLSADVCELQCKSNLKEFPAYSIKPLLFIKNWNCHSNIVRFEQLKTCQVTYGQNTWDMGSCTCQDTSAAVCPEQTATIIINWRCYTD